VLRRPRSYVSVLTPESLRQSRFPTWASFLGINVDAIRRIIALVVASEPRQHMRPAAIGTKIN
jgi:hypothetical protein